MKLLEAIKTGFKKTIEAYNKPVSFEKGENFEEYVREKVFTKKYFECLHKTHSYQENKGDYIKTSIYPDYKFKDRNTKNIFWIEAKYRGKAYNKIEVCSKEQLTRYKEVDKAEKTFIILGLEGSSNKPRNLYIIPVNEIKYNEIYFNYLLKYEILKEEIPIRSIKLTGKTNQTQKDHLHNQ